MSYCSSGHVLGVAGDTCPNAAPMEGIDWCCQQISTGPGSVAAGTPPAPFPAFLDGLGLPGLGAQPSSAGNATTAAPMVSVRSATRRLGHDVCSSMAKTLERALRAMGWNGRTRTGLATLSY